MMLSLRLSIVTSPSLSQKQKLELMRYIVFNLYGFNYFFQMRILQMKSCSPIAASRLKPWSKKLSRTGPAARATFAVLLKRSLLLSPPLRKFLPRFLLTLLMTTVMHRSCLPYYLSCHQLMRSPCQRKTRFISFWVYSMIKIKMKCCNSTNVSFLNQFIEYIHWQCISSTSAIGGQCT